MPLYHKQWACHAFSTILLRYGGISGILFDVEGGVMNYHSYCDNMSHLVNIFIKLVEISITVMRSLGIHLNYLLFV